MYVATDLHGHTLFSDGRDTPEAYVEMRRSLGMKAIAISDHDVLAGVRRGAVAAEAAGMFFVPAVEVTSFLHFGATAAEQFHVLAYYPQTMLEERRLEATYLFRRGLRVQEKWKAHVLAWLDATDADARAAIDPGGELARLPPPVFPALQSMITRIIARHRPSFEAFRDDHVRFWEEDRETFGWTPEEAIDAIRADGAIDVVAHPARYRDKERTRRVLDLATGVEVYTSRHRPDVAEAFRVEAEAKGKLWTSSSDDHQNATYVRPPCGTPVRTLERLLRKPFPLSLVIPTST